ncbi:caldesmon isoform X7 [Homo sapiens]|uniref:Isoform 2 of Caldesmon n=1 Tax=Homo sapiens TaxID=9606 RepID=Q05682-2|nr:caldesmon isoform X7 [Homo sapiens]XP_047276821.1 caldesmon isoform X7 [Homo sapiens]XP_047276822.1 caldesmon isoform X7 [Homo sapiens]XP_054215039.1 caldesmon isoform X7 [Homo sapiens]XP_054215040.1 caldesmon isoform X7 [Homo sapiens]XP_054215041.1 caldesmon isoform X7 [Homo sapiens]EAW83835.1 caldesmon 1, isoform CRA_j [Homo sapiens]|eukprot:XP_024302710.1 caldesmon isoform X2 [Homo sapiens]
MDDFERRRELRRQKREEMRLEAERIAYQRNDDDEEEAARERRRRARQERLRQKQEEESLGQVTDQVEVNAQNSVPDEEAKTTTTNTQVEGDDEAAFLERLARREERRQKRLQEALERQKEFDPTITDASLSLPSRRMQNDTAENETTEKEEKSESRQERYEIEETETVTKSYQKNDWRDAEENKKEDKEKEEEEEEKPKRGSIGENQGEEKGTKVQAKREKLQEDKPTFKKEEIKDEKIKKDKEPKEEVKSFMDRKKGFTEVKSQNGEFMTHKLKHTENTFSRPGGRASVDTKEAEGAPQVEAGKRLEELRRRRGETESEEFEKLKQKQQEAALELEELKKKREERRKVLEEEEQRRKQEEADRKLREEEEKRRLKEEIERRRAEAAEKRQKMPEDGLSDDKKPFKCFTPKGSSLKIEERAEFLNKSVQKSSGVKSTHQAAIVSKIDSRLEQYTSAIEGTKSAKPTKPAASDLPVPAEGVRNIKSMWEKGNVFSSPTAAGTPNKETAGLKVGVSSRINEWLTKTPDGNKSPAPKPSDLRPGDVSSKRNLWEKQSVDKVTSPTKV